ncbi:uncharacterized protein [Maniola hyperantus]|uniref:uncharacterized protein isoform X2 n=2 Tax=Aphantopus hyperantus TaxID=2795564 RepID=UPI003748821B
MSDNADLLFPSPRAESSDTSSSSSSHSKKKRRRETEQASANTSKKAAKITAVDLFGSDSEDEATTTNIVEPPRCEFKDKTKMVECEKCNILIPKNKISHHLRTTIHKSKCLVRTDIENIEIITTAFKNRIVTYRLNIPQKENYLDPDSFMCDSKTKILNLIKTSINEHKCIKIYFELFAYYTLPESYEMELKSFSTKYETLFCTSDLYYFYDNLVSALTSNMSEFEHKKSGWTIHSISHLEISISKYNPLRGGMYIDLPTKIKNTKSCLNIKNNDNHCFLWCVIAALFPSKHNVCRTSSYPNYADILNTSGMSFPPSSKDISLFEKNNSSISIQVYGLDIKNNVTGPLYVTQNKKINHINLLYIEKNGIGHYCLIKDLLRLVRKQNTKHKGKMFLCDRCLQFYCNKIKYDQHNCSKIVTELPDKNSKLKFKNYERKQKVKFVIYADFESVLLRVDDPHKTSTQRTHRVRRHQASCFGFYVCCSYDSNLNKYVSYRGSDCVEKFVKYLIEEILTIHNILSDKKPMLPLTKTQADEFRNAVNCHVCDQLLFDDRVLDHDHITGQYRGAAHSYCNLLYKECSYVPIVIHNLSGYDSHLFIEKLAEHPGKIEIIPKSKEKYLSITKFVPVCNNESFKMRFIDSFQFLNSSIEILSNNLSKNDLIHFKKCFPVRKQFDLLRKKGIYPYDYVDSWDKFEEIQLPPKENFYNSLKLEHISDDDYERAKLIWQTFDIHSLGDYTDLYLKSDVVLLCDIFESFRKNCLLYYKLDPLYYMSSPGLSWDAMLLSTGIQLDLIDDLEIYEFVEKGIRGGLAQCSLRHAKANNKYLPDYNDSKPSTYLLYLDCNNLYGYAMTKKIPVSDFRFLSQEEIASFDLSDTSNDSDFGYILEVDLVYPDILHDGHKDLPFAVEKFTPPGGKTSKLIANLYDKYKYVIHYTHLKECIRNGLILRKCYRILCFRQENFLKKYIDLNTRLRKSATSDFEKDFFKLLNNSVFGKTIENKRKQVNVKLVTKWNDNDNKTKKCLSAEKLIARPNLKNVSVFSENFVAIQLEKEKIILDRPIYIGFTVLEYAKEHLYKFHYNFVKKLYSERAKLCYTDTDSLIYFIETRDVYEDIKKNICKFDTSNYPALNVFGIPLINGKVPGLFKDELGGDIIEEFIGLRAKLYYINSLKHKVKKAKGISKCISQRLSLNKYRDTLRDDKTLRCKMNIIRSIKHVLYTQQINKIVLNRNDDKRQILSNQVETLPWGHAKTIL